MGKSSFRFGPGCCGGRAGGRAGWRPYRELAAPPFLLLTLIGIGRRRRRAGPGRVDRRAPWGSGGLGERAAVAVQVRTRASEPGERSRRAVPRRYVCRRPAGRGGWETRFLPFPRCLTRRSFTVFQLSRPEGGLSAFPGTSRSWGGGIEGAGGGREGLLLERRLQKSLQALWCNKSESSTTGPFKIRYWVLLAFSKRI